MSNFSGTGHSVLALLAAIVGTLSGFGTSAIMIPVLVMFLPATEAIFLVAIIHWFGDVWKMLLFRSGFNLRLLLLFGIIGLAASYFGALISLGANEKILLRLLGIFLAGYALFLIFQSNFKVPAGNFTALFGGALSGFFAGMFGIGGAIRSVFLSAFDLPKAVYIATAGTVGLLVDSTRIVTYFNGGATLPKELWHGLLIFFRFRFWERKLPKRSLIGFHKINLG